MHKKVNIILVIGKADTLTPKEVKALKGRILDDIETHGIQIYRFPDCDSDEDEEFKQQDRDLKASLPFAVVGSNQVMEVAGRKIRCRQYPWGVVDGKQAEQCSGSSPTLALQWQWFRFFFFLQWKTPNTATW